MENKNEYVDPVTGEIRTKWTMQDTAKYHYNRQFGNDVNPITNEPTGKEVTPTNVAYSRGYTNARNKGRFLYFLKQGKPFYANKYGATITEEIYNKKMNELRGEERVRFLNKGYYRIEPEERLSK